MSFQVSAQWTLIPSGTTTNLQAVHFPTDSIGYIVGDFGIVLKSIDTGDTWQTIHLDSAYSFKSVFFTSNDIGYAAAGDLYKTTDGGINWTQILTPTLNPISKVYFVNDTLGFASESGILYKTINAGNTWVIALTGTFAFIHFPSDSVGYFGGSYKTTDGGQSFTPLTPWFSNSILEAIYFSNDTIGYMCGWYNSLLIKTIDGGLSWRNLDSMSSVSCFDVYFSNENMGYYIDNGGSTRIRTTTDGGTTWTTQLNATNFLSEFFFTPSTGIAVGNLGTIYKTTNGGVGMEEFNVRVNFDIYPNPTSYQITIDLKIQSVTKHNIEIYSVLGQRMNSMETNKSKITLDISSLTKGIYFIVITDSNNKRMRKKIIKE